MPKIGCEVLECSLKDDYVANIFISHGVSFGSGARIGFSIYDFIGVSVVLDAVSCA
jgi:hypothetical protein